jgi:putative FmdB family regulatory protein
VPTYTYACTGCGERTEAAQKFTDDPLTTCAACGEPLRKVFSAVGVVFKGSGFYRTDSRASADRDRDRASANGGSGKDSGGKGSGDKGSGDQASSAGNGSDAGSSSKSSSGGSGDTASPSSSAKKKDTGKVA